MEQVQKKNILGTEPIGGLLRQFAVPSIIAMLVGALYNIVDQFFIGRSVGELGNAATNVAFPLTISCVALALLFGIGGAASFNLTLGGGDREKALFYIGNAATLLFGSGVILGIVALLCLTPMLHFFGSPDNVLAYAKTYTGITALGFPFLILTNGGGHLVRADGSPLNAMLYNLSGALINTVLDPLFIFGLHMGMAGAALATIIGQIFSGILIIRYLRRYKNGRLTAAHLRPQRTYVSMITSLGAAAFFNQLAMLVVQIVLNKSLTYYGAHCGLWGIDSAGVCRHYHEGQSGVFFDRHRSFAGHAADRKFQLWREKLCARAAGVWVGAQVGICGVGGVLCVFPVDSASDHRAVRGRIGDVFPVCGKIFPDLPVFHVLKLCAADCIEPVYGDWKTEKGYFPVPDAPDSLFAAADCDSAAVYRH